MEISNFQNLDLLNLAFEEIHDLFLYAKKVYVEDSNQAFILIDQQEHELWISKTELCLLKFNRSTCSYTTLVKRSIPANYIWIWNYIDARKISPLYKYLNL